MSESEFDDAHVEDDSHDDNDIPWNHVILACFLVQLVTFSGLVMVAFSAMCTRRTSKSFMNRLHHQLVPSFAAGALLATAVFLLIPESLALLQGGHSEEHVEEADSDLDHRRFLEEEQHEEEEGHEEEPAPWKFGVALLLGYVFPMLLGAIFPPPDIKSCDACQDLTDKSENSMDQLVSPVEQDSGDKKDQEDQAQGDDETEPIQEATPTTVVENTAGTAPTQQADKLPPKQHAMLNIPLAGSILLGDAFHNFTDGVFIGNAFLLCDQTVAFTIVATTIYHEIAQEIADFILLTKHCGLSLHMALALNFASGFSVLLGAVVILLLDLTEAATGFILAMSAGVYVYISASECIPRVVANHKVATDKLWFILCFAIGAVPIGLVLLNHGHCEAEH